MVTDSNSNDITFVLKPAESERGVRRIRSPKLIIFAREPLHVRRQFLV
jgi:hypothetical protein